MEKQAFPLLSACKVLIEYLGKDFLKELNMAFVSIGQKYGFVSIGDYFRQQMAEKIEERVGKERQQLEKQFEEKLEEKLAEEHQKIKEAVEEKINTARKMVSDQKLTIEEASAYFKLSKEEIMGK